MSKRTSTCRLRGGFGACFERTFVITLARRPERRERLENHLRGVGLDAGVEWVEAVDGRAETPPAGWAAGPGAWGCLRSHLKVLRRARDEHAAHVLLLEDDVLFSPHTVACLPGLVAALPAEWGQFYLGGQHLADPEGTDSPLLWRAGNINRTHAWAASAGALPVIIDHLESLEATASPKGWHVDHQLGAGHRQRLWEALTPSWWLAGQAAGGSDIGKGPVAERWWHHARYAWQLPLIDVEHPAALPPEGAERLHFDPDEEQVTLALASGWAFGRWCVRLAEQALVRGRLPARAGPIPPELAASWPAGVLPWPGCALDVLADYPYNGIFPHPIAGLSATQPTQTKQ